MTMLSKRVTCRSIAQTALARQHIPRANRAFAIAADVRIPMNNLETDNHVNYDRIVQNLAIVQSRYRTAVYGMRI